MSDFRGISTAMPRNMRKAVFDEFGRFDKGGGAGSYPDPPWRRTCSTMRMECPCTGGLDLRRVFQSARGWSQYVRAKNSALHLACFCHSRSHSRWTLFLETAAAVCVLACLAPVFSLWRNEVLWPELALNQQSRGRSSYSMRMAAAQSDGVRTVMATKQSAQEVFRIGCLDRPGVSGNRTPAP